MLCMPEAHPSVLRSCHKYAPHLSVLCSHILCRIRQVYRCNCLLSMVVAAAAVPLAVVAVVCVWVGGCTYVCVCVCARTHEHVPISLC